MSNEIIQRSGLDELTTHLMFETPKEQASCERPCTHRCTHMTSEEACSEPLCQKLRRCIWRFQVASGLTLDIISVILSPDPGEVLLDRKPGLLGKLFMEQLGLPFDDMGLVEFKRLLVEHGGILASAQHLDGTWPAVHGARSKAYSDVGETVRKTLKVEGQKAYCFKGLYNAYKAIRWYFSLPDDTSVYPFLFLPWAQESERATIIEAAKKSATTEEFDRWRFIEAHTAVFVILSARVGLLPPLAKLKEGFWDSYTPELFMRYLTVEQKLEHLKEGLGYLPIDPANHPLGKWSLYDAKIVSDVFSEMCEQVWKISTEQATAALRPYDLGNATRLLPSNVKESNKTPDDEIPDGLIILRDFCIELARREPRAKYDPKLLYENIHRFLDPMSRTDGNKLAWTSHERDVAKKLKATYKKYEKTPGEIAATNLEYRPMHSIRAAYTEITVEETRLSKGPADNVKDPEPIDPDARKWTRKLQKDGTRTAVGPEQRSSFKQPWRKPPVVYEPSSAPSIAGSSRVDSDEIKLRPYSHDLLDLYGRKPSQARREWFAKFIEEVNNKLPKD